MFTICMHFVTSFLFLNCTAIELQHLFLRVCAPSLGDVQCVAVQSFTPLCAFTAFTQWEKSVNAS